MTTDTLVRLSALEREHFGDPDKGTGIYATSQQDQIAASIAIRPLLEVANDLRQNQGLRQACATLAALLTKTIRS